MLPSLDARLAAAAVLVRPGEPVADLGCDHGKLTAVLAASGNYPKVIGADLRPGPEKCSAAVPERRKLASMDAGAGTFPDPVSTPQGSSPEFMVSSFGTDPLRG